MGTTTSQTVTTQVRISGWLNDNGYRFRGSLDEVALFNRLLSPGEITCAVQRTLINKLRGDSSGERRSAITGSVKRPGA